MEPLSWVATFMIGVGALAWVAGNMMRGWWRSRHAGDAPVTIPLAQAEEYAKAGKLACAHCGGFHLVPDRACPRIRKVSYRALPAAAPLEHPNPSLQAIITHYNALSGAEQETILAVLQAVAEIEYEPEVSAQLWRDVAFAVGEAGGEP